MSLILGSHEHLPYGTGDEVFERIYGIRVKPFISTLYKYPKIPAVLHYSGALLQWLERSHPEFFMLLEDLVSRKQVELLGGGFYEPMIPFIPQSDTIGQVEMLTTFLRKRFGRRPQGCWLPGLAWEQNVVGTLSACGMSYTFLDERQFASSGLSGDALYAPVISEDQGKIITVFPLLSRLYADFSRNTAPQVLADLREGIPPGGLVSIFPEHFFSGPGDSESRIHCFFEALSREEGTIEFTTPSRVLKNSRGLRKAFFPSSAEESVMYWAMDSRAQKAASGRGGDFSGSLPQGFLIKYPEANGIYSKMIFIHVLINQLRGDKARKRTAREELLRAQGYDVFCHIGDGGIYRGALRKTVYRSLLSAEKITREKGVFTPSLMAFDFDLDGEPEFLFQEHQVNCYVKTQGACVFELDYLPRNWNYLDTLARRREPYVEDGVPEDGYRRGAFLDRLAPADFSLAHVLDGRFSGSRFCGNERYELVTVERPHGQAHFLLPPRTAIPFGGFEVQKKYRLKDDTLTVHYRLANRGSAAERFKLIPEIDLSFPGEGPAFQRIFKLRGGVKEELSEGTGEVRDIEGLECEDIKNEALISLVSDRNFTAWIVPIRTRCRIDGVITDQYQSTCVMPVMEAALEPGEQWDAEFKLRIYH
jgi:hypothetical protein